MALLTELGRRRARACWWFWRALNAALLTELARRFQLEPESAAFSRFGFNAHTAAHPLDGFADNGQTYPGPVIPAGLMNTLKHLKQLLLGFPPDADPVVFEP